MIYGFKSFLDSIIVESLHPELKSIVTSKTGYGASKQAQLTKKIRELTGRGESTGIEGNMPKGSSRAYLAHAEPHEIEIDGKPAKMKTGIKVAIRSPLDRHHDSSIYDNMSLGHLQNEAEGGDHFTNSQYRMLSHDTGNKFRSNEERGIFPPLVEHDHHGHEWSHVGHVNDVSGIGFRGATKCESHPGGITHRDFCETLERAWNKDHGKYWERTPEHESKLNKVEEHPLVQKFLDHQRSTYSPPHDYSQIKNLGTWTHPLTGEKHIVARDHGFSETVKDAYQNAFRKKYGDHEHLAET